MVELNPLTVAKLSDGDCGLSFRFNYIALHFNVPVYSWLQQRFCITRVQWVVLYSLWLRPGSTARDICISSGFPKNTVSRAVQSMAKKRLLSRRADADMRKRQLYLTKPGRTIIKNAKPRMVTQERAILSSLTMAESRLLDKLLTKLASASGSWPAALQNIDAGAQFSERRRLGDISENRGGWRRAIRGAAITINSM